MKSLTTVFKEVYSEALAPYGFKKIKGRQPYFVRLIGDEIIHVITYTNYPTLKEGYKEFAIFGGVATVYRPRINLDITPRNNTSWLDSNIGFYRKSDFYDDKKDMFHEWYTFSYEANNEESMIESVKESFGVTEQVMLPILSQVTNLKSCIEYYRQFSPSLLYMEDSPEFGKGCGDYEYNEGLINIMILNFEEYKERKEKDFEKRNAYTLSLMKKGKIGLTIKDFEEERLLLEKSIHRQIAIFEKIIANKNEYMRVVQELNRRKDCNLNILKEYGFDI